MLLIRLILLIALVVCPWWWGGVSTGVHAAMAAISWICLMAMAVVRRGSDADPVDRFAWLLLLPLLLGILQLIPLPAGIVDSLSTANQLRDRFSLTYGVATGGLSLAPHETRLALSLYWMALAYFILARAVFSATRDAHIACIVVMVNGCLISLLEMLQRSGNATTLFWDQLDGRWSGVGPFFNRNNGAGFLLIALAAAAGQVSRACLASTVDGQRYRFGAHEESRKLAFLIVSGLSTAICLAGVLLSFSRGAYLGLIAAVISWMVVSHRWLRPRYAWGVISLLGLSLLLLTAGSRGQIQARFATINQGELKLQLVRHWQDDVTMVPDFWPSGCGIGAYRFVNRMYQTIPIEDWFLYCENLYLEMFVSGGILGLLLLVAIIGGVVISLFRGGLSVANHDHVALRVMGLVLLSSQAVAWFFDFGIFHPSNLTCFAFLMGVALQPSSARTKDPKARVGFVVILLLVGAGATWESARSAFVEHAMGGFAYGSVDDENMDPQQLQEALVFCPDHAMGHAQLAHWHIRQFEQLAADQLRSTVSHISDDEVAALTNLEFMTARVRAANEQAVVDQASGDREAGRTGVFTSAEIESLQQARIHLLLSNLSCPLVSRVHFENALVEELLRSVRSNHQGQGAGRSEADPKEFASSSRGTTAEEALVLQASSSPDDQSFARIARGLELVPQHAGWYSSASWYAFCADEKRLAALWLRRSLQIDPEVDARTIFAWDPEEFAEQVVGTDIELGWQLATKLRNSKGELGQVWANQIAAQIVKAFVNADVSPPTEGTLARQQCVVGGAYALLGDDVEAMQLFADSLNDWSPELVRWRYDYAQLLFRHDQLREAIRQMDICCQQYPDRSVYRRFRETLRKHQ